MQAHRRSPPEPWLLCLACALFGAACAEAPAGMGPTAAAGAGVGGGPVAAAGSGGAAAGCMPVSSGGAAGSVSAAAGSGGTAGGGSGGVAGSGAGPGSLLDPACWDGQVYAAEAVPAERASIEDLIPSFSVATRTAWAIQVLERRYPNGAEVVRGATLDDPNGEGNCFGIAYQPNDGWEAIIDGLRTSVHECGHMMDLQFDRYLIRTDLEYACKNDVWEGSPMRSILLDDEFDALGPTGGTLDFQKDVYLKPTGDGSGGDERWYLLFTEFSQYVNTLATSYTFYDYAPDDIVAGDASRDFAWFVERYLRILRRDYPAEYDKLGNDPCWRRLVLAAWGKLNRYWDASQGLEKLVSDEAVQVDQLLRDPQLLAEIENLRVLDGCRK